MKRRHCILANVVVPLCCLFATSYGASTWGSHEAVTVVHGQWGSAPGEFGVVKDPCGLGGPESIAVDADGAVYVDDWRNKRIQKFDAQGKYVWSLPFDKEGIPGVAWMATTWEGELVVAGYQFVAAVGKDGRIIQMVKDAQCTGSMDGLGAAISRSGDYYVLERGLRTQPYTCGCTGCEAVATFASTTTLKWCSTTMAIYTA